MAGTSDEIIYSDDYTRLARHESRSFNLGDMSLAAIGGIAWGSSGVAIARTFKVWVPRMVLPGGVALWWLGTSPILALLLVPVLVIVEYIRASKERDSGLTRSEEIELARMTKKLPTKVSGFRADTQPDEIDWQVIMFVPTWRKS